ncbi:DUF6660 family protein [Adhaeribacter aerolatus]|uniref:DUF6660 family protein n=1 Tax=Adhaeribacter aerolatus TaxID=670289 RepID=UPI003530CAC6
MKWLTWILTCLMVYMACSPCSDENIGISGKIITAFHAESDHEPVQRDICSPLCVCNCCSVISVVPHQPISEVAIHIPELTKTNFSYQPGFSQYSDSIWQPPRV